MDTDFAVKSDLFIAAVFIEDMISNFIGNKTGIENVVDSKILGNSDNAISFEQKMEFLLESNGFSIIDKSKLSVFNSIKNELSEDFGDNNIENCLSSSDKNSDFLLILYPQEEFLPRNEKLKVAIYNLIDDVTQLVSNYTDQSKIELNSSENREKKIFSFGASSFDFSKLAMLFSFLLLK